MKYQNEELVMRIRQGEAALFPQLWNQNKPLLFRIGNKLFAKFQRRCAASGVDTDDMRQACMLALWGAVNAYDPEKGIKLTAYFDLQFKRIFFEMLGMYRASRALDHAASLDAELPNAENGMTLGDTIPDAYAAEQLENVEDRCYNDVLHVRLDRALNTLPARTQQIIRWHYYREQSFEEIAQEHCISLERARQLEQNGLYALRKFDRQHNGYLSIFLGDGIVITPEITPETHKREAARHTVQSAFDRAEALQKANPDLDYAEIVKRLLCVDASENFR